MPLGSSSAAPVISPGPSLASHSESVFFIGRMADRVRDERRRFCHTLLSAAGLTVDQCDYPMVREIFCEQPLRGLPATLFPRLADDSARAVFARSGSAFPCGAFGQTLNF